MREISKTQKLQITTVIIVCSLIIYALGIATNFFANPIFSMFFIISYETAHSIVTYVSAGIAIVIIVLALSFALIKKRKTALPETDDPPILFKMEEPGKAITEEHFKLTPSINDQKITKYFESSNVVKEKQTSKQSEGQIICSICKEKFKVPLYQIDSSSSKLELIRICPYCRQSLDAQPENTLDDWWVRTFNTPLSTSK